MASAPGGLVRKVYRRSTQPEDKVATASSAKAIRRCSSRSDFAIPGSPGAPVHGLEQQKLRSPKRWNRHERSYRSNKATVESRRHGSSIWAEAGEWPDCSVPRRVG